MGILAIDPGPEQSAWLKLSVGGDFVTRFGIMDNADLKHLLRSWPAEDDHLAIEMVASYGMPVGREVFDTVFWIGRFVEAWGRPFTRVYRKEVKHHLCGGHPKADDPAVRQALIDRFGPGKNKAIGKKQSPGPLYGISKDVWAALAVAVTHFDRATKAEV